MAFFLGACMQNLILQTHPEWHEFLTSAIGIMDAEYLRSLQDTDQWLPGARALFAAFRRPLSTTRYILLGESPYPRAESANGYAFWDNAVHSLWSTTGLSKQVNRATSLRNIIKMLLFARGDLTVDLSQSAIARLDTSQYQQTGEELFLSFIGKGFLLLNASLVYSEQPVSYHARQWRPFIHYLLHRLSEYDASIPLVLLGRIAEKIPPTKLLPGLLSEHPYNISFITNQEVVSFFKPLDLLRRSTE
jgi:uracil-DNA glycosylase